MKKSKFPKDVFCLKCLSHDILKLKSGLYTCLNCGDSWKSGYQKPRKSTLEGETISYIRERQSSGVDLIDVQADYYKRKRERRERRET